MRKIVVFTRVSLDGVMQAPGGPEEDTSANARKSPNVLVSKLAI
jgi:hypothetical protein